MACAIVAQTLLGLSINCKALQHTQCLLVPPTLLPRNHRPLLLGDLVHCLRTVRNRDFLSVSVQDLRQFASTALFHSRLLRRSGGGIEVKTIQNLCAGHIQWSRLCARTYFAVLHFLFVCVVYLVLLHALHLHDGLGRQNGQPDVGNQLSQICASGVCKARSSGESWSTSASTRSSS